MTRFEETKADYKRLVEGYLETSLPSADCIQHSVLDAMQYSLLAGWEAASGYTGAGVLPPLRRKA